MRGVWWWLRCLGTGALVGLLVGLVVGGTLGRIFMRLLFLARRDSLGIETAMGAIIGDFTAGGTAFIAIFGAVMGLLLGIAYVGLRPLLPSRLLWRESAFVLAAGGVMLGLLVRINREDFAVLPVTLSLLLIAGSIVLTAAPVPLLVERLAPDRERRPGTGAQVVLGLGAAAIAVYASTAVALAYTA